MLYKFTPEQIVDITCLDCSKNVIEAGDYCMLSSKIWENKFKLGWGDNLCLACIEQRLGRKLSLLHHDFIAFPTVKGYPTSEALLDRYGHHQRKAKEAARKGRAKRKAKRP